MNTHADQTWKHKKRQPVQPFLEARADRRSIVPFAENRPQAVALRRRQEMANRSPKAQQLSVYQKMAGHGPGAKQAARFQAIFNNLAAATVRRRGEESGPEPTSQSPVQKVRIEGADYDNEEIWEWVLDELEEADIPNEYLPELRELFDELPEDETFEYFDEIASELVHQLNEREGLALEFEIPETVEEPEESSGFVWKALKVLTWLLFAQHVFSNMIPIVGATPVRGRSREFDEDLEGPFESEQPSPLQLMPPVSPFETDVTPALTFPESVGSQVPRSPTRLLGQESFPSPELVPQSQFLPVPVSGLLESVSQAEPETGLETTALMLPELIGSQVSPSPTRLFSEEEFFSPELFSQGQSLLELPSGLLETPSTGEGVGTERGVTGETGALTFPETVGSQVPSSPTRLYSEESLQTGQSLRDNIIWNIFSSRKNFGELPKIPRQDMSLIDWLINGPSWLYLPYTKFSPTELAVFLKHFHIKPAIEQIPRTISMSWLGAMKTTVYRPIPSSMSMLGTFAKEMILRGGYYSLKSYYDLFQEMQATNAEARSFRSDLASDPWIKNSYRHAYWMCKYAQKWTPEFALDLGYAHEYAHLDLTIEGPFDSLIDKINNFWGVQLASTMERDCGILVNETGDAGYLAWAKAYEESGQYLPTLHNIQKPLDKLWEQFQQLPEFNTYDLRALKRLRVELPTPKIQTSTVEIEEID